MNPKEGDHNPFHSSMNNTKDYLITFKCRTNEPFTTLRYANTKGTQEQGPS
jgi:hypothetical protein